MTATQFIAKSQEYWGPYPARSAEMVQEFLLTLEGKNLQELFWDLLFNLHFDEGPPSIASIQDMMVEKVQGELDKLRLTDNDYPGTEDLMPSPEDDLEIKASDQIKTGEHVGDGAPEISEKPAAAPSGSKEVLEK